MKRSSVLKSRRVHLYYRHWRRYIANVDEVLCARSRNKLVAVHISPNANRTCAMRLRRYRGPRGAYLVAYSPPTNRDGSYRRIEIQLVNPSSSSKTSSSITVQATLQDLTTAHHQKKRANSHSGQASRTPELGARETGLCRFP
jgi:hypothetical protein